MDLKYIQLFKNSFIILAGNAGSRILSLIMLPFYTKWLTSSDYGVTDIINVYSTFLLSIVTYCLAEAIFVFPKNKSKEIQKKYFSSALSFSLVSIIICGIVFYLLSIYFNINKTNNSFANNIWYIYAMTISSFLQQYIQQFVCSINKIKIFSLTGLILSLSTIGLSVILIPKFGIIGYLSSIIISNIVASLFSLVTSKSYNYFSISHINISSAKEMLKYSIPLIPNSIMWWLVSSINRPIMEAYIGLSAIGIFSVANKFPSIITMLFQIFSTSWQISVFEEFNKPDYKLFFNKILKVVSLLLIAISITLTIFSELIIKIFTNQEFIESAKYMPIIALSVVFSCISSFIGSNFSVAKESKYFLYSSIWGGCTSLISNTILIPLWGLWGASISFLFSFIIMTFIRIYYSRKYVQISDFNFYFKLLVLNCVVIGIMHFIDTKFIAQLTCVLIILVYLYFHRKMILEILRKLSKTNLKK